MGIFTEASRPVGCCGGWWCQLYRGEGAPSQGDWVALLGFASLLIHHLLERLLCHILWRRANGGDGPAPTCAAGEGRLAGDDGVLGSLVHLAHLLALQVGALDSANDLKPPQKSSQRLFDT